MLELEEGLTDEQIARVASERGVLPIDVAEAEAAKHLFGFINYVFRRGGERPERYNLIAVLGKGSFGTVYSASERGGTREPQFVVKEIAALRARTAEQRERERRRAAAETANAPVAPPDQQRQPDEYEFNTEYIERELRVGQLIRERLGVRFCQNRAICAEQSFFSVTRDRGYVVFPFFNAQTLLKHLFSNLHKRMLQLEQERDAMGYDANSVHTIIEFYRNVRRRAIVTDVTEGDEEQVQLGAFVENLRRQLYTIQAELWNLARQITRTLAQLHGAMIFHRDLKPANMLVGGAASDQVRLIDFGLACAEPLNQRDQRFADVYADYVVCPRKYVGTPLYRDPLAHYLRATTADERVEQNGKFDTYACGKVLQRLYDPRSFEPDGDEYRWPRVRRTEYMPPGVYELIVTMTGEEGYAPLNETRIRLNADEYRVRLERYARRPRMDTVAMRIDALLLDWSESEITEPIQ